MEYRHFTIIIETENLTLYFRNNIARSKAFSDKKKARWRTTCWANYWNYCWRVGKTEHYNMQSVIVLNRIFNFTFLHQTSYKTIKTKYFLW